jgi:hypothetical protein
MGVWILVVPWALDGATGTSRWTDVVLGASPIALSLPRGRIEE